jgi:hypothetical protein
LIFKLRITGNAGRKGTQRRTQRTAEELIMNYEKCRTQRTQRKNAEERKGEFNYELRELRITGLLHALMLCFAEQKKEAISVAAYV